ncbi:MAG TPA: hypothetical protein VMB49_01425 [Acidobacteriaceae bacterium]|nr:hypothetical protein [Acidobacteriaceae bacterium]
MALAIAVMCGAAALYCTEIIYDNIKDSGSSDLYAIPGWRAHMASGCIGATALVISLFLLERIGGRSKSRALRSVLPWLPLVLVTGFASIIHIPPYVVVAAIVFYSPYAYLNMRGQAKSDRS